jgi:hypothetical protein
MSMRKHVATLAIALSLGAFSAIPALADDVVVTPEAREKFRAGVALIKDPDGARYEEAYVAFKAAYAISPSPNMLGNLGLCALKLERDGEAIAAYTTYLEKGSGIAEEEKKQIETDLATMKSTLATVELEVTPAGATAIDERQRSNGTSMRNKYPLAAGAQKLGLRAGTHKITIALEGYVDQTIDLELAPGQVLKKTVVLEKPKEALPGGETPPGGGKPDGQPAGAGTAEMERPVPASVWAMLGVTGALAIGAGVTGGLALANKSDFDEANTGSDPENAQSLRDTGQALNITTDVLIGAAVASGAVTLILFFTRPEVPVAVAPTGTGAMVFGHF